MKKYILLVAWLSSVNGLAQISNVYGTGGKIVKEQADVESQGSPYLNESWKIGSIRDSKGKLFENVMVNYDCKGDYLVVMEGETKIILDAQQYPSFTINSTAENMHFKNGFKFDRFSRNDYFQVYHEGNVSLIKRHEAKLIDESVPGYGTNKVVSKLQKYEVSYLVKTDGTFIELKKNRGNVYDFLGNESRLKDYVKKHKLNLKDDKDLVKLLSEAENK